jgi:hypothetical protein
VFSQRQQGRFKYSKYAIRSSSTETIIIHQRTATCAEEITQTTMEIMMMTLEE